MTRGGGIGVIRIRLPGKVQTERYGDVNITGKVVRTCEMYNLLCVQTPHS